MVGLLDWIGERLDTPLRGVGIDTSGMSDAEKWGMRGRVVSAFGNSIGTNPRSFAGSLDSMAAAHQEAQQAEQMQQMMAQAAQGGGTNADLYMRYAQMFASRGQADLAKKYFEMAQALQPKPEEFGQPVEVMGPDGQPRLVQFGKTGAMRPVEGFGPRRELGAPIAAADAQGNPVLIRPDSAGGAAVLPGFTPPSPQEPNDVREYRFAVSQGYQGSFTQWQAQQRRAGAPNVQVGGPTVTIDPSKKLGDTLGQGLGEHVNTTFRAALAAQDMLTTIGNVRGALGNAITGPAADMRATLLRVQTVLGLAPGDTAERLADTRRVIQGLAQAELAAAEQMRGQGQITESERAILRRAAAGEINLSPSEILAVMNALESVNRGKIRAHEGNVERLRRIPGAADILPFYELNAPSAPAAPAGSLQDRAREELRRRQQGGR